MSVVALVGDWHGTTTWARRCIERISRSGVSMVYHLGDFGIWPGGAGRAFVEAVEAACRQHGVTIAVTPGNHEDYEQISRLPWAEHPIVGRAPRLSDHIAVLPRGHRWTMRAGDVSRSFVSLGGAPSVDLEWRTPGVDWWPEEALTELDVELAIAGGRADVMLTHDAPEPATSKVAAIVAGNPAGWSAPALGYAARGRAMLTRAVDRIRPKLLVHGHFHVRDEAEVTRADGSRYRILALDDEWSEGNVALLDLTTLTW